MSRTLTLRIAAVLSFLTALAHTIGTFMEVPLSQIQLLATFSLMKSTLVQMPFGAPKPLMLVYDGNNVCTSVLLTFAGAQLWSIAAVAPSAVATRSAFLTALALTAVAIISAICFFPAPAIFTGAAALLTIISLRKGPASDSK
jgi:hypothetical protein